MTLIVNLIGKKKLLPDGREVRIVEVVKLRNGKVVLRWATMNYPQSVPKHEIGDEISDGTPPKETEFLVTVHANSVFKLCSLDELSDPIEDQQTTLQFKEYNAIMIEP